MRHLTDILTESILDVDANSDRLDDLADAKLLFDTLTLLTNKNYGDYKDRGKYIGNTGALKSRKERFANGDVLGKPIKKGDLVLILHTFRTSDFELAYGIVTDAKNGEYEVLCGISPWYYRDMEIQKHYDDLSLTMDMVENVALGGTYKGCELVRIAGKNQFESALNKIKM